LNFDVNTHTKEDFAGATLLLVCTVLLRVNWWQHDFQTNQSGYQSLCVWYTNKFSRTESVLRSV